MSCRVKSIRKVNKKPRCKLLLDNGEFFLLSTDLIVKFQLAKGKELKQSDIDRILAHQNLIDSKQAAFYYASYKPRTSKQVIDKLKQKGFDEEVISSSIDFLVEFDLLDDDRFSKNYIENILRKKSIGINKIKIELLKKGVNKEIIQNAIEEKYPHHQTYQLAMKAATKKMLQIKRKEAKKQKPALINYLNTQGFDWETIRAISQELF